ncbi:MAG: PqqD family protein [Lachnospiraceae bacterium]|nr:PqqD family protein [Lachnospiraceae bacterium]
MTKLKLNSSYILRTILDQHIVMANGSMRTRQCIVLNDSGAFLWNSLQEPKSKEELVNLTLAEYDTTIEAAMQAVEMFLEKMRQLQILEESTDE